MDHLILEATDTTPAIDFNSTDQLLQIKGDSYPENTYEFYHPILAWLKDFFLQEKDQQKKATINIHLTYFNSSSSRVLYDIFDILESASKIGSNIEINWVYRDEEELESGKDFKEEFNNLNINLVYIEHMGIKHPTNTGIMGNLVREATDITPEIDFNFQSQQLNIIGNSYPENTYDFYEPILQWLTLFFDGTKKATFNFHLEYFNSSSSKVLYDLFDVLDASIKRGNKININWYYVVDDELESGKDFQGEFKTMPVNFIKINSHA